MAGIGDALDYDPAADYIGTGSRRPRFVNGRPGMGPAQPAAAPPTDEVGSIGQAMGTNTPSNSAGQTYTSRSGIAQPFQNTPEQQAYINAKQATGPTMRAAPDLSPATADQPQGIGARMADAVGDQFSPVTRVVGRTVGRAALGIGGALVRNAGPIGDIAYEGMQMAPTLEDPRATGYDKAAAVSKGIGRGFSTMAGAGIGAAAGSAIPVVGTVLGGLAGGIAGYYGGDKAIQWGRNLFNAHPYEAPGIIGQAIAAGRASPSGVSRSPDDPRAIPSAMGGGQPIPRAQSPAAEPSPSSDGKTIYQNADGGYTDTPGLGATPFVPARGGYAASTPSTGQAIGGGLDADATRQRILDAGRVADQQQQADNEARARQQQQIGGAIDVANNYQQRQVAQNNAQSWHVKANLDQWRGAGRAQVMQDHDKETEAASAGNSYAPQGNGPSVEQEAAIGEMQQKQDIGNQQADVTTQQQRQAAAMQAMDLKDRQQMASMRQQLGNPNLTDQQRQQIGTSLLYAQGKDPRQGAYQRASTVVGTDAMGQPIKSDMLYDTNNQKWLVPPSTAGQQGRPQAPSEGSVVYRNGNAYVVKNGRPVEMAAAQEAKGQQ